MFFLADKGVESVVFPSFEGCEVESVFRFKVCDLQENWVFSSFLQLKLEENGLPILDKLWTDSFLLASILHRGELLYGWITFSFDLYLHLEVAPYITFLQKCYCDVSKVVLQL